MPELAIGRNTQGSWFQPSQTIARHHHDIEPGEQGLMVPERLANNTFDAVSCNRKPDPALRQDKADAGNSFMVVLRQQHKAGMAGAAARCIHHPLEVGRREQAVAAEEGVLGGHVVALCAWLHQAGNGRPGNNEATAGVASGQTT